MDILARLGVTKVINASGHRTVLGGSLMPEPVIKAINEAARHYVEIAELQRLAGKRIAELTGNEDAYISNGAAAGLQIAAAACMTGGDVRIAGRLPNVDKNEIVMLKNHRNPYDLVFSAVGARIVEVGFVNETHPWQLEDAIGPKTAAIFYFLYRGGHKIREGSLSIEEVVEIAHARNIPVILDAASQVPPISTLWEYNRKGVDLVVVSGGKAIRGPQGSGIVIGRKDLVEACRVVGPPNYTLLRALKVTKEEIAGVVAAVEWALERDEKALLEHFEAVVKKVVDAVTGIPGVLGERVFPAESGQSMPIAVVHFTAPDARDKRQQAMKMLKAGTPSIVVRPWEVDGIMIQPLTIEDGEDDIVAAKVRDMAIGVSSI